MAKKIQTSTSSETGAQLFARFQAPKDSFTLEKTLFDSVSPSDIIQIAGSAGSGKTELLYHFVAQCILPTSWNGLKLEGSDINVTYIDNNCHFNIFRLVTILELRLLKFKQEQKVDRISSSQISEFVIERLKLLELRRCYDSDQLIITLCALENALRLVKKTNVIMIDSLSAFYHIDKARYKPLPLQKFIDHQSKVVNILRKLNKNCSAVIIVTKQILMDIVKYPWTDKYILGNSWEKFVTCKLDLDYQFAEKSRLIVSVCKRTYNEKTTKMCAIKDSGFSFP